MEGERAEVVVSEHHPHDPPIRRWRSQDGSVDLADTKVKVKRPRIRDVAAGRKVPLTSHDLMKGRGAFSEGPLRQFACRVVGAPPYGKTVRSAVKALGVSSSSVSRHIVEATAAKLTDFRERDLSDCKPVAAD